MRPADKHPKRSEEVEPDLKLPPVNPILPKDRPNLLAVAIIVFTGLAAAAIIVFALFYRY